MEVEGTAGKSFRDEFGGVHCTRIEVVSIMELPGEVIRRWGTDQLPIVRSNKISGGRARETVQG